MAIVLLYENLHKCTPNHIKANVYHLLLKNLLKWVLSEVLGSYLCLTQHASCGIFFKIHRKRRLNVLYSTLLYGITNILFSCTFEH